MNVTYYCNAFYSRIRKIITSKNHIYSIYLHSILCNAATQHKYELKTVEKKIEVKEL